MPDVMQTCPRCARVEPAGARFCACGHEFQSVADEEAGASPLSYAATPPPTLRPGRTPFARHAARAAVAAPVVTYVVGCLTGPSAATRGVSAERLLAGLNWSLTAFGLAMSLVALYGIRRHGARGILVPALVGLLLNAAGVAAIVYHFWMPARAGGL